MNGLIVVMLCRVCRRGMLLRMNRFTILVGLMMILCVLIGGGNDGLPWYGVVWFGVGVDFDCYVELGVGYCYGN